MKGVICWTSQPGMISNPDTMSGHKHLHPDMPRHQLAHGPLTMPNRTKASFRAQWHNEYRGSNRGKKSEVHFDIEKAKAKGVDWLKGEIIRTQ